MSFLSSNTRLFARLSSFIRTSRVNATTTTANTGDRVPVPIRRDPKYFRIGAMVAGVVGLLVLFRMARKERKLIEHTVDHQHEPPVAK